VNITRAPTSHDRTVITVLVLLCGTALLWQFSDATPIVALVASAWTLTLTFWFRVRNDGS
jgi:hypothetical protein